MSGSVLVLHTGGTIGMVESPDGRAPEAGALAPYLDWIVENSGGELPPIAFLELDPPIDSANATPDEWCDIAGSSTSAARTTTASSSCTGPTRWPTRPRRSRSCCRRSASRSS